MAALGRSGKLAGAAVALATVLAVVATACQANAQGVAAPGATTQLVEARKGSLRIAINATGSVALTEQQKLTFGSAGTIETVGVKWGQGVKKGQILAKLDTRDLEFQVAKAKVSLANALDAQQKAKEGLARGALDAADRSLYSEAELAKAEATVQAARAAVQSAQSALDKAKAPYTAADVAKAEAAVLSAQAAVQSAQGALDKAKAPYTAADVAKAEGAAASAQAAVQKAQSDLDNAGALYSAAGIARAEAAVRTAQVALDAAKSAQSVNLASARGAVADAQVALAAAQRAQVSVRTQQDSLVRQAEDTLANARTTYANGLRREGYVAPDGDAIYEVAPVSSLGAATTTAYVTLYNNWRALLNARDALAVARATRESALASADNAVLTAQRALTSAQSDLDLLLAGSDQAAIQFREAELAKAQEDLATIKRAASTANAADVATKASALQTAQANLKKAQEDLDAIKNGPNAVGNAGAAAAADIALKASSLQTAQANLKKAQEDLETLRKGPDPMVLLLRQSDVDSAKKALADAEENLGKSAIKAPYDGVVSDVPVIAGQIIAASTVAVALVDPNAVEINALVDEIDVAQLGLGQQAMITMDALPSARLMGQVSAIAPVGTVQQGVVSYRIAVSVRPQQGVVLREGMTAQANIVVSTKDNVLLVPVRAVRSQGGSRVVRVALDGKLDGRIEERTVQVGTTNESQAEIVSGLKEGEKVVVEGGASRQSTGLGMPGMGLPGTGGLGAPVRR